MHSNRFFSSAQRNVVFPFITTILEKVRIFLKEKRKKERKRNLIGADEVKVEGGEATDKPGTNEGVNDKQSRDGGMEESPPESAIVGLC